MRCLQFHYSIEDALATQMLCYFQSVTTSNKVPLIVVSTIGWLRVCMCMRAQTHAHTRNHVIFMLIYTLVCTYIGNKMCGNAKKRRQTAGEEAQGANGIQRFPDSEVQVFKRYLLYIMI